MPPPPPTHTPYNAQFPGFMETGCKHESVPAQEAIHTHLEATSGSYVQRSSTAVTQGAVQATQHDVAIKQFTTKHWSTPCWLPHLTLPELPQRGQRF